MKKFWEKIVGVVLCAIILCSVVYTAPSVSLTYISESTNSVDTGVDQWEDIAVPLVEETTWYVRIYNGKLQKRLWSITEGKWLTDWIDCN